MFNNIGLPGLILILILALIIFGPQKLPEIGRAFGNSLREFKKATQGLVSDDKGEDEKGDAVYKAIDRDIQMEKEMEKKERELEKRNMQ